MFPSADTGHPICTSFDQVPVWPDSEKKALGDRSKRRGGRENNEIDPLDDEIEQRLARRRKMREPENGYIIDKRKKEKKRKKKKREGERTHLY